MSYSLTFPNISLAAILLALSLRLPTLLSFTVASTTTTSRISIGIDEIRIRNNIFRYGQYCGPGPDESFWNHIQPVDTLDQQCQQHDKAYRSCLETLSNDTGFKVPKIVHQIMAMRGLIAPFVLLKWAFAVAPSYMSCMHAADRDLVVGFERVLENDLFPKWWTQPAEAPVGTEGVQGFKEACALGLKGQCAVSSKRLFEIMLAMFRRGVVADTTVAPQILSSSSSPSLTMKTGSLLTNNTAIPTATRTLYFF